MLRREIGPALFDLEECTEGGSDSRAASSFVDTAASRNLLRVFDRHPTSSAVHRRGARGPCRGRRVVARSARRPRSTRRAPLNFAHTACRSCASPGTRRRRDRDRRARRRRGLPARLPLAVTDACRLARDASGVGGEAEGRLLRARVHDAAEVCAGVLGVAPHRAVIQRDPFVRDLVVARLLVDGAHRHDAHGTAAVHARGRRGTSRSVTSSTKPPPVEEEESSSVWPGLTTSRRWTNDDADDVTSLLHDRRADVVVLDRARSLERRRLRAERYEP